MAYLLPQAYKVFYVGSLQLYIWTEIATICVTENMVNSPSFLTTIIKLLGTDYN